MKKLQFSLRPGMTDYELVASTPYDGTPLACHTTMAVGNDCPGLSSPSGRTIRRGEPLSCNVAYWGSNVCRAGWVAESASDLPSTAKEYVAEFVGPYFEAMAVWLSLLRIGQPGGRLDALKPCFVAFLLRRGAPPGPLLSVFTGSVVTLSASDSVNLVPLVPALGRFPIPGLQ